MNKESQKFYYCEICGNVCGLLEDSGVPLYCCGEAMIEMKADSSASVEKHKPEVLIEDKNVMVKVEHPMDKDHYIDWVYIQTTQGGQRKVLTGSEKPTAVFCMAPNEKPIRVFSYCNKHGLWSTDIDE